MAQDPQAKVYAVAKVGNEYEMNFKANYSIVRTAISIIGTQAEIARDKGLDVRKIGKYHFFKTAQGLIVMMYYCNINNGLKLSAMRAAYEAGVNAYNS